jgi:hypothetical protein
MIVINEFVFASAVWQDTVSIKQLFLMLGTGKTYEIKLSMEVSMGLILRDFKKEARLGVRDIVLNSILRLKTVSSGGGGDFRPSTPL